MARNMDAHLDLITEYEIAEAEVTKIRRELRLAEEHRKSLLANIVKVMGKSRIATINGEEVFAIRPSGRRNVTIDRVMEVCPNLASQLITVSNNPTLKWLRKGIAK